MNELATTAVANSNHGSDKTNKKSEAVRQGSWKKQQTLARA